MISIIFLRTVLLAPARQINKGNIEFADIVVTKNKAIINFNIDMYKLDCGSGHPSKINLKKR